MGAQTPGWTSASSSRIGAAREMRTGRAAGGQDKDEKGCIHSRKRISGKLKGKQAEDFNESTGAWGYKGKSIKKACGEIR